jgi:hypothetical protein
MSKMKKIGELAWLIAIAGALTCTTLLSGCDAPDVPIYLSTSRTHGPVTDPSPELQELLDESFGFWGVTYTLAPNKRRTAIQLDIIDIELTPYADAGRHSDGDGLVCDHDIWVHWDVMLLTHELGHAFGIDEHSKDPSNIMYIEWPEADDVTDKQLRTAEMGARRLDLCR